LKICLYVSNTIEDFMRP